VPSFARFPEQALVFFEQILEATTSGVERAALLHRARREAAEFASSYDRAGALYEEAIAYYEAARETNAVGRATVGLAHVLEFTNRFSDVIERCERAFHVVGDDGDERVRAKLACELTWAHHNLGSYGRALEWSETGPRPGRADRRHRVARPDDRPKVASAVQPRRHREAAILAHGGVALARSSWLAFWEQTLGWMGLSFCFFDDDLRESLSAQRSRGRTGQAGRAPRARSLEPAQPVPSFRSSSGSGATLGRGSPSFDRRDLPLDQRRCSLQRRAAGGAHGEP